jgi:predicted DNA-binding protein YlxM (UPF0122 family)
MKDLLDTDDISLMKQIDNHGGVIQTDVEKSGWGFFSPEISFFLVDFCREQLTPIQSIIFYAYYVNGMTLEEIAERLQSSHQSVHHKIVKIEKKLRYSWQYMDRWNDHIITKNVKGKKVRVFNPNKKEK